MTPCESIDFCRAYFYIEDVKRINKKKRRNIIILIICCAAVVAGAVILVTSLVPSRKSHLPGADYACAEGFEGLRVKRVIEAFDLKNTTGMGGAYYDQATEQAVSGFQQDKGLEVTGEVDFETWKALGLSEEEWNICGAYQSPCEVSSSASSEEKIEAMISRAYEYLSDPYVIGASGPPGKEYGLDCSGLVMQGLYAAGVALSDINPVTHAQPGHEYESRNMWNSDHFTVVKYEDRERGDLIFYSDQNGIVIHVAIYLGDDQVIESWPDEVQVSPVTDYRHPIIQGVKRVF